MAADGSRKNGFKLGFRFILIETPHHNHPWHILVKFVFFQPWVMLLLSGTGDPNYELGETCFAEQSE